MVQQRAGEAEAAASNGVMIADRIMRSAWPFLRAQRLVVLGARAGNGDVWASMVYGPPGFVSTTDGHDLQIDLTAVSIDPHDPLWPEIASGEPIGAVVLDPATRRRIRINGTAQLAPRERLTIRVTESYPNCPKYIARRIPADPPPGASDSASPPIAFESTLPDAAADVLRQADTFYIATRSPDRGLDVSHRGGFPGFVRLTDDGSLRWPDFAGNSMFNTLGNLVQDPHAGLVVPDSERGLVLQATGTAVTEWEQPDEAGRSGGTHRFVRFQISRGVLHSLPPGLRTAKLDDSPWNPPVG